MHRMTIRVTINVFVVYSAGKNADGARGQGSVGERQEAHDVITFDYNDAHSKLWHVHERARHSRTLRCDSSHSSFNE